MENKVEVKFEKINVEDVSNIEENVDIDLSSSEIIKFYEGATIFITGGTGFLGNLILEKILRICPNISRIYLLVRPKRGLTAQERFEKIFGDVVSFNYFILLSESIKNTFKNLAFRKNACKESKLSRKSFINNGRFHGA